MPENENQKHDELLAMIVDGPVKEILIDGFSGALWGNDIIQLNLYRDRLAATPGDPNERVIVARLSMGLSALASFHEGLTELMDELRKYGYFSTSLAEQDEAGENDDK